MHIIREHIRRGGLFALVALAINLALSFGHIHTIDAKGGHHSTSPWIISVLSSYDGHAANQSLPDHPDIDLDDALCAICMAASEMASGMAPLLPAVSVEFKAVSVHYAVAATRDVQRQHRSVFQSRGPPLS